MWFLLWLIRILWFDCSLLTRLSFGCGSSVVISMICASGRVVVMSGMVSLVSECVMSMIFFGVLVSAVTIVLV